MGKFRGPKFGIVVFILQLIFLLIFGFSLRYKDEINAAKFNATTNKIKETKYFYFQDVQGMMFLGFGFLMVFLRKYGFSSVGINFLLCGLVIQWALIMNGVKHLSPEKTVKIDVESLLNAEFTVAAILISMGAVLGKLSPLQYVLMALAEVPIMAWNEYLGREIFFAVDIGDSIFVHTFGAYFGLGVAWIISGSQAREHEKEGSRYNSELFAMVGTLLLWIFWPSFNAGGAQNDGQQRAIVNTVVSLAASTMITFVVSSFVTWDEDENVRGKFKMVYVQNATLAGGVAVGACADLMIEPWGALLIGSVAGIVSTLGFQYVTPLLTKIYLHDTCGVHNLHGMPGIIGGIGSAVAASVATADRYGTNVQATFSKMPERSPSTQAGFQLAALGCTIIIALFGGLVVGVIFQFIPLFDKPNKYELFDDETFWETSHKLHNSDLEMTQVTATKSSF